MKTNVKGGEKIGKEVWETLAVRANGFSPWNG
jgi:hypothetical protein